MTAARGRGPLLAAGAAGVLYLVVPAMPAGLRMLIKPLPAAILAGLVLTRRPDAHGLWIGLGLALSALGDLLLVEQRWFLAGLVAFLAAHVTYTVAFVIAERRLRLTRALPFAIWISAAAAFLLPHAGPLAVPVAVYMTAIGAMMWRAAARVGRPAAATSAEWSSLAGAVLFGMSDTILAVDRFRTPVPFAPVAIMLLYWAGQYGIARSVLASGPS